MKSRIHLFKINKCIIFSTSSGDEKAAVQKFCSLNKLLVHFIDTKNYGMTIREISESKNISEISEIDDANTQFLVICGFGNSETNKFLNYLSSQNVTIPLKCVATEYNCSMTISECIECIKKEHLEMHKARS